MKKNMTYHSEVERAKRNAKIIDLVGDFGDYVLEVVRADHRTEIVTSTGLIIIKSADQMNVTFYIGSVEKVSALYHCAGYHRMPNYLYKVVKRNAPFIELLKNI